MGKKVHFYDSNGSGISDPASTAARYATANHSIAYGISSLQNFTDQLDWMKSQNDRINALVIETHGSSGAIYFGDDMLSVSNGGFRLAGRGYEDLFEPEARIFLNGCNVAVGEEGKLFLKMLGDIFFKKSNGSIGGSTSAGLSNFFNGKTYHLWGDTIRLFYKGGKYSSTSES